MIPNIVKGRGITGAIRYAIGEGNDPETGKRREIEAGAGSRAEIVGGQNFGFAIDSADRLELARRTMEWAAMPEHQASRTKKCVRDCLHMSLSWEAGQNPGREEMERAAQDALKALGMERARAVFIAHHDTAQKHVHIIASRIDPGSGRTFSDTDDMRTAQAWGLRWERENHQVSRARKELHGIVDAVQKRDALAILKHLTERQSTFTAKELDRALSYGLPDPAERQKFRLEVLANPEAIGLRQTADDPVTRYTTREVLASERAVLRAADRMEQRTDFGLSSGRINAAAALNAEQAAALRHATDANGFAVIAGEAGTGKSRTLGAIRAAYEAEGYRVLGMAWTNAVAQDLRAQGFTNTSTIAAELKRLEAGAGRWDRRTVLIVDEAAMLSTRHLAEVTTRADAAGAKLILAGDDRQLASIERGGMFGVLREQHGAALLRQVQRTKDHDQQRAFNLMHEGEFGPALDIFAARGAVNWTGTQQEALRGVAEKYASDIAADPAKQRFIFAYTNADVATLNQIGRRLARDHGRLGEDVSLPTADGPQAFATGDRIQFTGNAANRKGKNVGLVNGAVGTVRAIEDKDGRPRMTVELDTQKGHAPRVVRFTVGADREAGEFNSFRHGYAGTIYKGQGRTLDQSYVYHSQHWRAASAYVALTRHRDSVAIFAARETAADLTDLARQMSRDDRKGAASEFVIDAPEQGRPGAEPLRDQTSRQRDPRTSRGRIIEATAEPGELQAEAGDGDPTLTLTTEHRRRAPREERTTRDGGRGRDYGGGDRER